MTPEKKRELRAALYTRGIKYADIAKKASERTGITISETTVAVVACGHGRSALIESVLADAAGHSVSYFWPDQDKVPV